MISRDATMTRLRKIAGRTPASSLRRDLTEERKYAILFAATLLSARRLIENMQSDKPHLNEQYFVDKAIDKACFVLERIEWKFPAKTIKASHRSGRRGVIDKLDRPPQKIELVISRQWVGDGHAMGVAAEILEHILARMLARSLDGERPASKVVFSTAIWAVWRVLRDTD